MSGTKDQEDQPGAEKKNEDQKENQGTGGQGDNGGQAGDEDALYSDPAKVKELVKSLRDENAKHRKKNKELESKLGPMEGTLAKLKAVFGGEDDESDPAEKLEKLTSYAAALESELAIRDLADEHGVPAEQRKYFKFLLAQKFEQLEEDEELSDEALDEVLKEVRSVSGKKTESTGAGAGKGGNPPPAGGDTLTVEQFANMNNGEKSALYVKDQALYNRLFQEAVAKKLI